MQNYTFFAKVSSLTILNTEDRSNGNRNSPSEKMKIDIPQEQQESQQQQSDMRPPQMGPPIMGGPPPQRHPNNMGGPPNMRPPMNRPPSINHYN